MRHHNLIWLAIIVLFYFETTIFHWLIPMNWQENIFLSPRFVFVVVLFVALFVNRHYALVLGLVFGLLHDVVFYGYMIGPYAFGMGLVAYIIGLLFNNPNLNFFLTIPIIMLGIFSFELINYSLYRLFRIIDYSLGWNFVHHSLPSLLVNLLFVLIAYVPIRYMLDSKVQEREHN